MKSLSCDYETHISLPIYSKSVFIVCLKQYRSLVKINKLEIQNGKRNRNLITYEPLENNEKNAKWMVFVLLGFKKFTEWVGKVDLNNLISHLMQSQKYVFQSRPITLRCQWSFISSLYASLTIIQSFSVHQN